MSWFDEQPTPLRRAVPRATVDPVGTPVPLTPPAPAPPPATTPAAPAPTVQNGDYKAFFKSLFPGATLTPQQLVAQEAALKAQGIRILGPNARGERTKIELPNGQIVDVIGGAGSGDNRNQWLTSRGGPASPSGGYGLPPGYWIGTQTGGGQYPLASAGGPGLAQPWTTPFVAPNVTEDPGYQFRMQEGQKALERSAAARGTLLTGGMLKDLGQYSQGLASQEYGNAYARRLGEYTLANSIYNQNQTNLFNRLSGIGGGGQTATSGLDTSGYANAAAGNITDIGNARAAGTVGTANAINQAAGQAPYWYWLYQQRQQGQIPAGVPIYPSTSTSAYPGTFYPEGSFTP